MRVPGFRQLSLASLVPTFVIVCPLQGQTGDGDIVSGPLAVRSDSLFSSLQVKGFSGVVLVANDGAVILSKGYGFANRATKSPMTSSSVVQIGSNTKDFTAVAILQLIERGKLALTDSVGKFLGPAVPVDKRGVTIEHLLRHRGGFPQHIGADWDRVSRTEAIAEAMATPLLFPPGTDRQYSNTGYSLLAAIIETVSGTTFDRYVQDNILTPIGLRETGLHLPKFDPKRAAHGYRNGEDMGTFLERSAAPDGGPYWHLRGNGGMLSTVGDMYRFYKVLMGDARPLLTPTSRDIMFRTDMSAVLAGSDGTYFFLYGRDPVSRLETIVVSNSTDYPAPQARQQLMEILSPGSPTMSGPGGPGGRGSGNRVIDTGPAPKRVTTAGETGQSGATFPDTPVGRAVREYFDAYASGDTTTIRKFLETRMVRRPDDTRTIDQRVAAFREMHQRMGAFSVRRVVASSDNEITVSANASDGTVTFVFTVEAEVPNRITGIRVEQG